MNAAVNSHEVSAVDIASRVDAYEWSRIPAHLDAHGWAMFPGLLTTSECAAIVSLYADDSLFRSRIVMARHDGQST
jgi:hypothetical protein